MQHRDTSVQFKINNHKSQSRRLRSAVSAAPSVSQPDPIGTLFAALVVAATAAGFSPPSFASAANAAATHPTLGSAGRKIGLLVGASCRVAHLKEADYAKTLAHQYTMIEPSRCMKWDATEPALNRFTLKRADAFVAFARAHHLVVRGHNLLWTDYNPAWLANGHFKPSQLRQIMKRHIETVVKHFAGKIYAWDAMNEAFNKKGQLKDCIWYDKPGIGLGKQGTAYIAKAFIWAHRADPRALLFYNDYACEDINAKSNAVYAMVKAFKRSGVPISGVGFQMHLGLKRPRTLAANMARFVKLGLQVQVTEMDVGLDVNKKHKALRPADFIKQAAIYRYVAGICARQPGCTAFQTWGFTDKYTWLLWLTHGAWGAPLPFDAHYRPKPAFYAVLAAFQKAAGNRSATRQRLAIQRKDPLTGPWPRK